MLGDGINSLLHVMNVKTLKNIEITSRLIAVWIVKINPFF